MIRKRVRVMALAALFISLALFVSGCGSGVSEVTGKVTFSGKPVSSGSVILYCSDGQIVCGVTGADGSYTIPNVPRGPATATIQAHTRVPAGLRLKQNLPPSINGPTPPTGEVTADQPVLNIPARYALPEESGLSVVVDRGQVNYDIDLKP